MVFKSRDQIYMIILVKASLYLKFARNMMM